MRLRYYIILLGLLTMVSCQKKFVVKDTPDFSVSTDSASFKANTPVIFKIKGSADIISFYSGELFHDYAFRNGRVVDVSGMGLTLSFKTGVAVSIPPGTQQNQFSILVSTDFTGNYSNLASVKAATWQDITDSFVLGSTSTTLIASTTKDLSTFVVPGKPIYFALKYINLPQIANGFATTWIVESFTLNSKDSLGGKPVTIADQAHAGFQIVDENPVNAPARSSITTTRVTLYGPFYKDPNDPIFDPSNPIYNPNNPIYNPDSTAYVSGAVLPIYVAYVPNSPYNDPQSENWAVSAPIFIDTVNFGNDWAVSVRSSVYTAKPALYKYTYKLPGTYKAYFVASNNTIDESKQVVKEVDITITP